MFTICLILCVGATADFQDINSLILVLCLVFARERSVGANEITGSVWFEAFFCTFEVFDINVLSARRFISIVILSIN